MKRLDVAVYLKAIRIAEALDAPGRAALQQAPLFPAEQHLLQVSGAPGRFTLYALGPVAPLLRVEGPGGRFDLRAFRERSARTLYLAAFLSLCERGLVQHEGGTTFTLSEAGREKAAFHGT
jgi:hypothetical protein